jgi:hypothetical protein
MKLINLTKIISITAVLSCALGFGVAKAESNELPIILQGQTTYTEQGSNPSVGFARTIYGGMTGNEAILNLNPSYLVGFIKDSLEEGSCYDQTFTGVIWGCFRLDRINSAVKLMAGQTKVNGAGGSQITKLETVALVYGSKTIQGDAYSGSDFLKNFAFWGRNLAQSSDPDVGITATWRLGSYILNPEAQSTWGQTEFNKYDAKLRSLASEATVINANALNAYNEWYLTGEGDHIYDVDSKDQSKYPDGKTWIVKGDLTISSSKTYHGKGTIFIDGNLTIDPGVKINHSTGDTNSQLGIVVLSKKSDGTGGGGEARISSNVVLNCAMLTYKTINLQHGGVNNNISLSGSFVSADFSVHPQSVNIRFSYDYNLSQNWPPGFRYLNMPQAEEK